MITSLQIGLTWAGKRGGGADRVFADLAVSLPGAGVDFKGVVAGPAELYRVTGGLVQAFAPESSNSAARLRGARRTLTRLIHSEKPEILASHFALYTAPIIDKLSSQPFVMHFHGPWSTESQEEGASGLAVFVKHSIERQVYRRADRVIVLSPEFGALLSRDYGVPRRQNPNRARCSRSRSVSNEMHPSRSPSNSRLAAG